MIKERWWVSGLVRAGERWEVVFTTLRPAAGLLSSTGKKLVSGQPVALACHG